MFEGQEGGMEIEGQSVTKTKNSGADRNGGNLPTRYEFNIVRSNVRHVKRDRVHTSKDYVYSIK